MVCCGIVVACKFRGTDMNKTQIKYTAENVGAAIATGRDYRLRVSNSDWAKVIVELKRHRVATDEIARYAMGNVRVEG